MTSFCDHGIRTTAIVWPALWTDAFTPTKVKVLSDTLKTQERTFLAGTKIRARDLQLNALQQGHYVPQSRKPLS
jgi:hypothetical protein